MPIAVAAVLALSLVSLFLIAPVGDKRIYVLTGVTGKPIIKKTNG